MKDLSFYQKEVNRIIGSLEHTNIGEESLSLLLEKQTAADNLLNEMRTDELQNTILFESLLAYGNSLVRAENAQDRLNSIEEDLMTRWRKRLQHIISHESFSTSLKKLLSPSKQLSILERIEGDFIFEKLVDYLLQKRGISQKILDLDPNKEYKLEEIEEIDEAEALKAEKEAFRYILIEEEKLENYTNDYFFHRARGIKKIKVKDQEVYKIISLTIGKGYTPMFNKGEEFELEGVQYKVATVDIENRFPARNVLLGRLDENLEIKLRVRVPIHVQVYHCVLV